MFAGDNPTDQFLHIMPKLLRIAGFVALAALILPACARKQSPTASDTVMGDGPEGGGGDFGDDLIPAETVGDFGLGAEGLELRDPNEGIGDGFYNGREMVTGVLPSVYFGFDSSAIGTSERSKLQEAADYLEQNPNMGLLIEGHCDWYGTAEYNLALGDRRANSAKDYLTTLGIQNTRIDTLSKGSLEATSGLSKSDAAEDRRADLILLR